jgi:hypothetical protein
MRPFSIAFESLMVPAAPIPVGQATWTREQQLALLASTGLLAVHPKDTVCGEPIKGAATAATQKQQQQKPRKRVLGAALQQVLKYQLIDHDIGPVDLRFVVLLFDQQGRLVDGTNAMTKREALDEAEEGGRIQEVEEESGHKMMAVSSRPRPPCLPD